MTTAIAKKQELTAIGINANYRSDVKVFTEWAGGRTITPELIKDFFEAMKGKRSPSTLGRYRAALKAALLQSFGPGITLAQRAEVDAYFREIKTGRRDTAVNKDRTLDRRELAELKKAAGPKTRAIIKALFETACRVSELVNIRLDDCTAQGPGIIVNIRRGKGGKQGTVYLSRETFDEVRGLYQGKEYLFEFKGRPLRRETIYKMVNTAGKKIGRDIGPHCLRHTWASMSIESLELSQVSQYLRHSSPAVTAAYYLHGRASMPDILAVNQLNGS